MMIQDLQVIFGKITLSDIDALRDISNSQIYKDFLVLCPDLNDIFNIGKENNLEEFNRTTKHIFRTIKVYLSILDGTFNYPGLSMISINQIQMKIKKILGFNSNLLPLILVYHDIGKFIRKRDHPQQSYNLIREKELLKPFELNVNMALITEKVIQYHVLFATIYTGESTYYGTYSLIHDNDLVKTISNQENLEIFVDCLEVFTYIDILGYSYSQIFDHYLNYYRNINQKLKEILSLAPQIKTALDKASFYSNSWIEWRLAGALRIFQFVSTQPYLTEDFHYEKLKKSIKSIPNDIYSDKDWNDLIEKVLQPSYRIQIKYGLAFLMILAFGSFHRASLDQDFNISPNLIAFWIILTEVIIKRSEENLNAPWNVYILGIKNWFSIPAKSFKKIDISFIRDILKDAKSKYDSRLKEFYLSIDLSRLENID